MRFVFDVASYVVLLLAALAIFGGIGVALLGFLFAMSDRDAGIAGGFVILWGIAAFVQGCLLALFGSYCRLRVSARDEYRARS